MTTELTDLSIGSKRVGPHTLGPDESAAPHPANRWRAFITLFLLDLWERFSFYGMVAILFLYGVAEPVRGGMGLPAPTAAAMVGAYIAGVFLCSMPGAWLGDRILGTYRAVLFGAILIAGGHSCLAIPAAPTFPLGLLLIASGTGLLKPNLTVLLGSCYLRESPAVRDAVFSIFYISIQLSAFAAPLVTGYLGEFVNWHVGFGAAAVGMAVGVACFVLGGRWLGDVGRRPVLPATRSARSRLARRCVAAVVTVGAVLAVDSFAGTLRPVHIIAAVGLIALVAPVLAFRAMLRHPALDADGRRRVRGYVSVFLASALFWMLFSQSLSLLVDFAANSTDRVVHGWSVPASWFQSLNPLFILLGAPIAAWLWLRLGDRAGFVVKFGVGHLLAGLAFLLLGWAAHMAHRGPVSPLWLVAVIMLLSVGELVLAPAGLGVTVGTAPPAFASQMMGLWWLSAAMGAGLGSQLVRLTAAVPIELYFLAVGALPLVAAVLLVIARSRLKLALFAGLPSGL